MMALPSNLYNPCRDTLRRCAEFQSYRTLRAVFVTDDLFPFRFSLPKAHSPEEQVDLLLDHLIEKRLKGGHPVLPLFLATLSERYQRGDALRDDLEDLHQAIYAAMSRASPAAEPTPRRTHLLKDRLLQLNFLPQVKMVQQVVEENRVAAFVIHGPPEHGQRMLTHRLTHLKPEWETGQRFVVDAGSNGVGKSSRALWAQLKRKLQLPPSTTVEDLATKVSRWWQTQDVVFIFHTIDYMPCHLLSAWIEEFWGPLVSMAHQAKPQAGRNTRLLLFLVDYAGEISHSDLVLARSPDDLRQAPRPLLLPALKPFHEIELEYWIVAAAEVVPGGLEAADLVGEPIDGIPALVYEKICEHSGFSFEGEIAP